MSILTSTVVIINYNNYPFIKQCIDSVLSQTHMPNQIIFCDDASTDDSLNLVKDYPSVDIIAHSTNVGPLHNCLDALMKVKTDLVFFLDSDDIWEPLKIEKVIQQYELSPSTILISHNHKHVDVSNNILPIYDSTHANIDKIKKRSTSELQESYEYKQSILFRKGGFWLGSAYSFRLSAFDIKRFNILINKSISSRYAYPDLSLAPFIVATNISSNVACLDDYLFHYRRHSQSSTPRTKTPLNKVETIKRLCHTNRLTSFLLQETVDDPTLAKALLKRYRSLLLEYDYLEFIYSGKRIRSLLLYLYLIPHFYTQKYLIKETIRLILVFILGPEKLVLLEANRNSRLISS